MSGGRVSVVMPCRNEGNRVLAVLDDIGRQDIEERFEVVIADGSDDGTRERLEERAARGGDPFTLRIITNPDRIIPVALNRAISVAVGELIIRIDAHANLPVGYLREMADHLAQPGVAVAGPQIYAVPSNGSLIARIIAWCQNSRLGNGGTPARNRHSKPLRTHHTPMSCYPREVWVRVGGYDEWLHSNEDFDFDWRANAAGFAVWTFPTPEYRIVARGTLRALARQRWRYGRWKAAVVCKHPRSLSLRQLVPMAISPLLLATIVVLASGLVAWEWLLLAGLVPAWISLDLMLCRLRDADDPRHITLAWYEIPLGVAVACLTYAVIHVIWSVGCWRGLFGGRPPRR